MNLVTPSFLILFNCICYRLRGLHNLFFLFFFRVSFWHSRVFISFFTEEYLTPWIWFKKWRKSEIELRILKMLRGERHWIWDITRFVLCLTFAVLSVHVWMLGSSWLSKSRGFWQNHGNPYVLIVNILSGSSFLFFMELSSGHNGLFILWPAIVGSPKPQP